MGTFLGHLVPGMAIIFLGLWHMINNVHLYYLNGSTKFRLRYWYPFKSPWHKLDHVELITVMCLSILAILIQLFDLQSPHLSFKLDNIEHSTMFLHLLIFEGFTLFSEINHLSEMMLRVSGILVSSVFGMELFLLHFHSTDHIGLEGHYHWLMQLIVCISLFASLSATTFPTNFPIASILSVSVVFQGCWFINMGSMLWVPKLVPQGCSMETPDATNGIMQGAIVCETNMADSRARALANLQFCWIFAAILIFKACLCIYFGRRSKPAPRQGVEYEQLSSGAAHDHLPTFVSKQIQL
ncbi:hypothetical protein F511_33563 [Dorcoceras hygrometricum]|uniref:Transmembrane protein 45B n=1 Tax=Dorcoceras hygrometricum TaxID=472368 RepID=A0A2Z7BWT4_9LAMI|nr:hypothetical protein F511_33563 [Dorcoceras hygrometricum]